MDKKYRYTIRWREDELDGHHWFGESDNPLDMQCTALKAHRRFFISKKKAFLIRDLLNFGLSNPKKNGYKVMRVRVSA